MSLTPKPSAAMSLAAQIRTLLGFKSVAHTRASATVASRSFGDFFFDNAEKIAGELERLALQNDALSAENRRLHEMFREAGVEAAPKV